MKPTELRIGNYITGQYYGDDDEIQETFCEVLGLDGVGFSDFSIWVDSESNSESFESFKGIEITEDWLENLGLIKNDFGYYYFYGEHENGGRFVIVPMRNTWTLFLNEIEGLDDSMELISGFNYVHELQNLHFVLTGEELKLK